MKDTRYPNSKKGFDSLKKILYLCKRNTKKSSLKYTKGSMSNCKNRYSAGP